MRSLLSAAIGAALVFTPLAAGAQDTTQAKRLEFTGDLGFVNASGNASVTTFNVGDKLVFKTRNTRHIITQLFALVYGRSNGETVANNWRANGRYEYSVGNRLYLFALFGVDRDRLAGMDRRFEESLGLTWKALVGPRTELGLEGGLSLIQERATAGTDDDFLAGRASAVFRHKLRETASVNQSVEFLPNLEDGSDYRINSETALLAALSRRLSFKVAYAIRYDNTPEPGFVTTDRLLTTGLQVAY